MKIASPETFIRFPKKNRSEINPFKRRKICI